MTQQRIATSAREFYFDSINFGAYEAAQAHSAGRAPQGIFSPDEWAQVQAELAGATLDILPPRYERHYAQRSHGGW